MKNILLITRTRTVQFVVYPRPRTTITQPLVAPRTSVPTADPTQRPSFPSALWQSLVSTMAPSYLVDGGGEVKPDSPNENDHEYVDWDMHSQFSQTNNLSSPKLKTSRDKHVPAIKRRVGRQFFPNGMGMDKLSNCTQAQNAAFPSCKSANQITS